METNNQEFELLYRGRLTAPQKNRMRKLWDMLYSPKELAEEIGINRRQFYFVYIPAGCPHEKDEKGYLWINGKAFREWFKETFKKRKLGKNQGYCRTCHKGVVLVNPGMHTTKDGYTDYLLGDCPYCGRSVPRIIGKRRGEN